MIVIILSASLLGIRSSIIIVPIYHTLDLLIRQQIGIAGASDINLGRGRMKTRFVPKKKGRPLLTPTKILLQDLWAVWACRACATNRVSTLTCIEDEAKKKKMGLEVTRKYDSISVYFFLSRLTMKAFYERLSPPTHAMHVPRRMNNKGKCCTLSWGSMDARFIHGWLCALVDSVTRPIVMIAWLVGGLDSVDCGPPSCAIYPKIQLLVDIRVHLINILLKTTTISENIHGMVEAIYG